MKYLNKLIPLLFLVVFLLGGVPGLNARKTNSKYGNAKNMNVTNIQSFENPDFNFPKTVIGNARPVLNKALADSDSPRVLKALLEICSAETSISADSADKCVALADSVAERLDGPWRSLALLIGADIVKSVYTADKWNFNRRSIPQTEIPEQMSLWDMQMFRTRICDMIEASVESSTGYTEESLSRFDAVLNTDRNGEKTVQELTFGDFINYKSLSLLSGFDESESAEPMIPFVVISEDKSDGCQLKKRIPRIKRLTDFLVSQWEMSLNPESPATRWIWFINTISGRLDFPETACFFSNLWKHLGDSDIAPILIPYFAIPDYADGIRHNTSQQISDNIELRDFYKQENLYGLAEKTADRYPDNNALKEVLAKWQMADVRWEIPSFILPGTRTEIKVDNRNLKNGFLTLMKLPEGSLAPKSRIESFAELRKCKKIVAIAFGSDSKIPFNDTLTITLPPLETGRYCSFLSTDGTINGLKSFEDSDKYLNLDIFEVTGLAKFSLITPGKRHEVFITEAAAGTPVSGAKIKLESTNRKIPFTTSMISGTDGSFVVPQTPPGLYNLQMEATSDNTALLTTLNVNRSSSGDRNMKSQLAGRIFMDRPIARPGDKVRFAAVIYSKEDKSLSPASETTVPFRLINASYVETDSLTLTTDRFGRCEGEFTIPAEGLLGTWTLRAMLPGKNQWQCPESTISIEEYKHPTNILVLNKPELASDSVLVISGRVETYSGMPVAGAGVSIDITTWNRWWFAGQTDGRFKTETVTDRNGQFHLRLSRTGLDGTGFADASFCLTATSVSESGELAEDRAYFALGNTLVVVPDIPSSLKVDSPMVSLPVRVFDKAGSPRNTRLAYSLRNETGDDIILAGIFETPELTFPSDKIPSGTYTIEFTIPEGEDGKLSATGTNRKFVVWRESDITPAGESVIWLPENRIIAEAGKDSVEVRFGSKYKNQNILCVVSDVNGEISRQWISPDGRMTSISVPAPQTDTRLFVTLTAVRKFVSISETAFILPSSESTPLRVRIESFRDKLTSATRETWRFKFTDGDKAPVSEIPAMAVMTDKALEALAHLNWSFTPRSGLSWSPGIIFDHFPLYSSNYYFHTRMSNFKTGNTTVYPTAWLYTPYAPMGHLRELRMMKFSSASYPESADAVMTGSVNGLAISEEAEDAVMADGVLEENALRLSSNETVYDSVEQVATDKSTGLTGETKFREAEFPVAFFLPMLTSGKDGSLEINFEVPDFNTTWQFKLMGYDNRMETASLTLDAVSTKPVMIQTVLPRFARTSDHLVLNVNAYNNSVKELSLGGKIEIIDPGTGKILVTKKFKGEKSLPGTGRILSLEWDVPSDVNAVIIRALAEGGGHSDGEQSLLTVLPASSPVIESVPFWLSPDETGFSLQIPEMDNKSAVTLLYCDNPAWYCLTALPTLTNVTGKTLTSLLYAYYGNAIGAGLLETSPELSSGLKSIIEMQKNGGTDILTSNLQRNSDLKAISSGSTPWVNSATSETARMESLGELLDSVYCRTTLDRILSDIASLQNTDGGMLWYPDARESSIWCSGQTLLHFAMLEHFGYLPHNDMIRKIVGGATEYCRNSILEDWRRLVKKYGDSDETLRSILPTMTNFLYVTSKFGESEILPKERGPFAKLARRSLKMISESWGNMGIYDKATAASLLASRGETGTAYTILSSLSEFAMSTPRMGMWFDNLSGGSFSPWNKLITTAQVLEAYSEIEPGSPCVDALRQWLLLQRQTENWGEIRDAAELVQAILSSGTSWTVKPSPFEIKVGSHTILSSKNMPRYGEMTVTLRPEIVSGKKLMINREARGIAWGGIIRQYIAPMSEIVPVGTEGLSIEKNISLFRTIDGEERPVAISQTDNLTVGDKIRIFLTVDTDRDMEYVTITDERGACMEPIEAMSGTDMIDGRFLYREVRDAQTNFFLNYLPKGHYQFSYDCILTSAGTFSAGISTIQSQYSPQLTAHSGAVEIMVKSISENKTMTSSAPLNAHH